MQYRIQTYTRTEDHRAIKHGVLVFGIKDRKTFDDTFAALQMAGVACQASIRVFAQGGGHLDFQGDTLRHVREALDYMLQDVDAVMYPKPKAVAAE